MEIETLQEKAERIKMETANEEDTPELTIKIDVAIDGDVVATRTAFDFEGAEENLGKLRKWYESEQEKFEAEAERTQEKVNELESKDIPF